MDGPPTILRGWRFSKKNLEQASKNLISIIKIINCDVILDHHLLRDIKFKDNFPKTYQKCGTKVKTFAEYLGEKNNTLEAHRKELWRN
jgi:predicted metallo-beta-lactamase superfamily hydrolase